MDYAIILVGILLALIGIAFFLIARSKKLPADASEKFPKGHYVSLGMATFMPIGIALGLAVFDNIAIGLPIGLAIGIAVGTKWERENADKIRPMTDEELEAKKTGMLIITGLIILLALLFIGVFFFLR